MSVYRTSDMTVIAAVNDLKLAARWRGYADEVRAGPREDPGE